MVIRDDTSAFSATQIRRVCSALGGNTFRRWLVAILMALTGRRALEAAIGIGILFAITGRLAESRISDGKVVHR
ncbi:hypothetical protein [Mycobacterium sp.]|uniref:hypothetical protein n=1 Tax=Mycobacterium sp. TaxID=1785 RepID=UPI003D13ED1A